MTTSEVLKALSKGATLCMEYDETGQVFWLEPRRQMIERHVALGVIPMLKPGDDQMLGTDPQTWKVRR